jgi:hypothetical protein
MFEADISVLGLPVGKIEVPNFSLKISGKSASIGDKAWTGNPMAEALASLSGIDDHGSLDDLAPKGWSPSTPGGQSRSPASGSSVNTDEYDKGGGGSGKGGGGSGKGSGGSGKDKGTEKAETKDPKEYDRSNKTEENY